MQIRNATLALSVSKGVAESHIVVRLFDQIRTYFERN